MLTAEAASIDRNGSVLTADAASTDHMSALTAEAASTDHRSVLTADAASTDHRSVLTADAASTDHRTAQTVWFRCFFLFVEFDFDLVDAYLSWIRISLTHLTKAKTKIKR